MILVTYIVLAESRCVSTESEVDTIIMETLALEGRECNGDTVKAETTVSGKVQQKFHGRTMLVSSDHAVKECST